MSVRLRILNFFLKWTFRPILNRVSSKNPAKLRPWLDKPFIWGLRPAKSAEITYGRLSGLDVPVLKIKNGKTGNGTLFYLHGGAYIFGSTKTHARLVAHLCGLCGLKGLSVNYRVAPEHPFPAALEDALAVYKTILADGSKNIILSGDSAGGGLALALLAKILSEGIHPPEGIVTFSPWTDMSLSGKSMITNDKTDYLLPPHQIRQARDFYAPNDVDNPFASPILADFTNAPPALIFASNSEVLFDDAAGIAKNMQSTNVDVTLKIYDKTPHVWVLGHGRLPEADRAIEQTCAFITRVLQN